MAQAIAERIAALLLGVGIGMAFQMVWDHFNEPEDF